VLDYASRCGGRSRQQPLDPAGLTTCASSSGLSGGGQGGGGGGPPAARQGLFARIAGMTCFAVLRRRLQGDCFRRRVKKIQRGIAAR
jgi:hypothetical protein